MAKVLTNGTNPHVDIPAATPVHIRLCDTAVNVAVRECLLEHSGLGCRCEIRIQDNQILMLSSKLDQSIAVALSRCNLYF